MARGVVLEASGTVLEDVPGGAPAQIAGADMRALGASPGDAVEIRGSRATVARCALPEGMPPLPEGMRGPPGGIPEAPAEAGGMIGLDLQAMYNAGAVDGMPVAVSRARAAEAAEVELAPLGPVPPPGAAHVAGALAGAGAVVCPGDVLAVPYSVLHLARFQVNGTGLPPGASEVTARTRVRLAEEGPRSRAVPAPLRAAGTLGGDAGRLRRMLEGAAGGGAPAAVILRGITPSYVLLVAREAARALGAHMAILSDADLADPGLGRDKPAEARRFLADAPRLSFEAARRKAPAVVAIDHVMPHFSGEESPEGPYAEERARASAALLSLVGGLGAGCGVAVVAAAGGGMLLPGLAGSGLFSELPVGRLRPNQ